MIMMSKKHLSHIMANFPINLFNLKTPPTAAASTGSPHTCTISGQAVVLPDIVSLDGKASMSKW